MKNKNKNRVKLTDDVQLSVKDLLIEGSPEQRDRVPLKEVQKKQSVMEESEEPITLENAHEKVVEIFAYTDTLSSKFLNGGKLPSGMEFRISSNIAVNPDYNRDPWADFTSWRKVEFQMDNGEVFGLRNVDDFGLPDEKSELQGEPPRGMSEGEFLKILGRVYAECKEAYMKLDIPIITVTGDLPPL